jgi:hypothetical protein
LVSVILPIVEHVHDITDVTKPNTEGSAFVIQRSGFGTAGPIAIRAYEKSPAPAKAERGNFHVKGFLCDAYSARFHA